MLRKNDYLNNYQTNGSSSSFKGKVVGIIMQKEWMKVSFVAIIFFLTILPGCGTTRPAVTSSLNVVNRTIYEQPTKRYAFKSQEIYNYKFDAVWEAVISFFAENNISIETIEKVSGIIVAVPLFNHTAKEAEPFIDFGTIKHLAITYEETFQLQSASSSFLPQQVTQKLISRKEISRKEKTAPMQPPTFYETALKFNVFCRKVNSDKTDVKINLQIKALGPIEGITPAPISKGMLENTFLKYLSEYLQSKK